MMSAPNETPLTQDWQDKTIKTHRQISLSVSDTQAHTIQKTIWVSEETEKEATALKSYNSTFNHAVNESEKHFALCERSGGSFLILCDSFSTSYFNLAFASFLSSNLLLLHPFTLSLSVSVTGSKCNWVSGGNKTGKAVKRLRGEGAGQNLRQVRISDMQAWNRVTDERWNEGVVEHMLII